MRASFAQFLFSLFLSRLADQILLFLVPLVVFQVTGSVAWSGLAFAAETFPRFLAYPISGALCDRYSPIKLMQASQVLRAIVCVIGGAASAAFGGVGWLVALSAVCGVLTTQGIMAREVLLPQAFRSIRFEKVLAYSQAADQGGAVLGPLLAALLLGWWRWEIVVGAAAAIFLLADIATTLWERGSQAQLLAPEDDRGWIAPIQTAFSHVIRLPGLRRLVILAAGVNLVIGVTGASSAALFTGLHAQSASHYAWLQTAGAVTTIVILLAIAHSAMPLKWMGITAFSLIFAGGVLTALSPNAALYVLGFLLIAGFDKMFNVYIRSSRQKIIPPADYGKTTGVIVMLNNLTQPLAGLAVGLFASHASTGAIVLALTLLMGVLALPGLKARR